MDYAWYEDNTNKIGLPRGTTYIPTRSCSGISCSQCLFKPTVHHGCLAIKTGKGRIILSDYTSPREFAEEFLTTELLK